MIDCDSLLQNDVLRLYNAYRRNIRFEPTDIVVVSARNESIAYEQLAATLNMESELAQRFDLDDIGSNNWVVSGDLTQDGWPMMVNDPHRAQSSPSLRYWAHLVGPGWNVIGGGEPTIPGISIGHNEYGAWGLTVFNTDGEDLLVYEINPDNPNEYRYNGQWESMSVIEESIPVRGQTPEVVQLKYTRHGPVVFEDAEKHLAYAVRPAWMEFGGAPYLASQRMDQPESWEEFRESSN